MSKEEDTVPRDLYLRSDDLPPLSQQHNLGPQGFSADSSPFGAPDSQAGAAEPLTEPQDNQQGLRAVESTENDVTLGPNQNISPDISPFEGFLGGEADQTRKLAPINTSLPKAQREPKRPANLPRQKSGKVANEAASKATAAVRTKTGDLGRRGRGHEGANRGPGLPPRHHPHAKSGTHLAHNKGPAVPKGPHAIGHLKPSGAQSRKSATLMKRSVSWNELQSAVTPPERSFSANIDSVATSDGPQKAIPAPKRLLQKLSLAGNQVFEKGPVGKAFTKGFGQKRKLPPLQPMEKSILASVGQRDWIKIDNKGEETIFRKDKHLMVHELGIQIRDLRLLDPLMMSTYPSAILFREKALVVNLEYIQCIITQDCTLILDADQPYVQAFRQQLRQRLRDKIPFFLQTRASSHPAPIALNESMSFTRQRFDPPFELKALEAALDNVCMHLETAYIDLDNSMRPMLGTHTVSKVTSDYLERLRRLKTRLVRLKTRVETLKEVLDKILGDEGDMKAIHLTGRMRERKATFQRRLVRTSLREGSASPKLDRLSLSQGDEEEDENERDIEEVENLLSPYHLNLDATLNKLQDVSEFVDDAEEMINLEMNTYRNNNIKMRVGLGICHMFGALMWSLTGVLGMNLATNFLMLPFRPDGTNNYHNFLQTTIPLSFFVIVSFLLLTYLMHRRGLAWTSVTT